MTAQRQSIADKQSVDRIEVRVIYKDKSFDGLYIKGDAVSQVTVYNVPIDDNGSQEVLDISTRHSSLKCSEITEAHNLLKNKKTTVVSNLDSNKMDVKARWVVKMVKRLKALEDKNKLLGRKYLKALEIFSNIECSCGSCPYEKACGTVYEKESCRVVIDKCIEGEIISDELKERGKTRETK
ncbi:unnamed protein product [marine sediment metagenome]|uniref:Uncharacterized protein n=1 Tax=marine sediment metagenome TaxID=412755 RepID=X0SZ14_9ZZZZ